MKDGETGGGVHVCRCVGPAGGDTRMYGSLLSLGDGHFFAGESHGVLVSIVRVHLLTDPPPGEEDNVEDIPCSQAIRWQVVGAFGVLVLESVTLSASSDLAHLLGSSETFGEFEDDNALACVSASRLLSGMLPRRL